MSENILSKAPLKILQLKLIKGASAANIPGEVWLHTEKRAWARMIKGIMLIKDSLKDSSAGILIEYLTTIALLHKYQKNTPIPKTGIKSGISPLYMMVMNKKSMIVECY